jgi:hypothetical protein
MLGEMLHHADQYDFEYGQALSALEEQQQLEQASQPMDLVGRLPHEQFMW